MGVLTQKCLSQAHNVGEYRQDKLAIVQSWDQHSKTVCQAHRMMKVSDHAIQWHVLGHSSWSCIFGLLDNCFDWFG